MSDMKVPLEPLNDKCSKCACPIRKGGWMCDQCWDKWETQWEDQREEEAQRSRSPNEIFIYEGI